MSEAIVQLIINGIIETLEMTIVSTLLAYVVGLPSQLYVRVFGGDVYNSTDEENTLLLADTLENFFISLGLRTRLTKLDIGSDRFEAMAKRATRNGKVGHYIPLGVEEIVAILDIALTGTDR